LEDLLTSPATRTSCTVTHQSMMIDDSIHPRSTKATRYRVADTSSTH